jgi:hypothetical protein
VLYEFVAVIRASTGLGFGQGSSGIHVSGGPTYVRMHAGMVRLGGEGVKGPREGVVGQFEIGRAGI